MNTGLIQPCINLIENKDGKTGYEEMDKHFEHFLSEVEEVKEAYEKWKAERTTKNATHLGEEFVDVATMATTMLKVMELLPELNQIKNFDDHVLLMVASKNYARGYHNEPMI